MTLVLDGTKEEVPAWEHGLHLTIFLSSSVVAAVVSVHLLIATHLITAFDVPPAAQIVVAAAIPIIIIIAVSIVVIIVTIGLVFVLLLLLFVLVVLAIVAMVSIAFHGPFADGDDYGEGRGEEPPQEEHAAGAFGLEALSYLTWAGNMYIARIETHFANTTLVDSFSDRAALFGRTID